MRWYRLLYKTETRRYGRIQDARTTRGALARFPWYYNQFITANSQKLIHALYGSWSRPYLFQWILLSTSVIGYTIHKGSLLHIKQPNIAGRNIGKAYSYRRRDPSVSIHSPLYQYIQKIYSAIYTSRAHTASRPRISTYAIAVVATPTRSDDLVPSWMWLVSDHGIPILGF